MIATIEVDRETAELNQMTLREVVDHLTSEARNETFAYLNRLGPSPGHKHYKLLVLKALAIKLNDTISRLEKIPER